MEKSSLLLRSRIAQALVGSLFPRIRSRQLVDWPTLLDDARRLEFDMLERIGMVSGLVLVTWLLRPLSAGDAPLIVKYVIQFLLALPLLLILVGPFLIRRTRRGLDRMLEKRDSKTTMHPRAEG